MPDDSELFDALASLTRPSETDFDFSLGGKLPLERCPHCGIATPHIDNRSAFNTTAHDGSRKRYWQVFECTTCGGMILAGSRKGSNGPVTEMYPTSRMISPALPDRARHYLGEALDSLNNPSAAAITAASAVDAMLQVKGYDEGSLYSRIKKAAEDNLITDDMAKWANDIRLEANAQRHADEDEALPDAEDARRCVDFAEALGEFLFVLPARVKRGREQAEEDTNNGK